MHFTIITPSYNQVVYLKRCIASVRDQVGLVARESENKGHKTLDREGNIAADIYEMRADHSFTFHHHVQDACSSDGSREFLAEHLADNEPPSASNYTFSYVLEPDDGMYEAINRGVELAIVGSRPARVAIDNFINGIDSLGIGSQEEGDGNPNNHSPITNNCHDSFVAWLNCDEQYLPGTLQKVADYFATHPEVDFVYGNALLVDAEGKLLTYRKNPPLRKWYVQSDHLYTQSCSMFFRERIFRDGFRFDTKWKAVSDCDFVIHLLDAGYKAGRMNQYIAIFTVTGDNISSAGEGVGELCIWRESMPLLFRLFSMPLRAFRYFEKFILGGYREQFPLEYAIYSDDILSDRQVIRAESGTSKFVSWSR